MTRLAWLLAVVLLALAALTLLAPAWLVDVALRRASDNRLRIDNASGTLWNGHGDVIVLARPFPPLAAGVHWSLAVAPLLGLRAEGRLWQDGVSDAESATTFALTRDAQSLARVRLKLDAGAAGAMYAPALWQAQGMVDVSAPELALGAEGPRGSVDVVWHPALLSALDRSFSLWLGEVRLPCSSAARGLDCQLDNSGGEVALHGNVHWTPAGGLQAQARVRPLAGASPPVMAVMQQLAQPGADGSLEFRYGAK